MFSIYLIQFTLFKYLKFIIMKNTYIFCETYFKLIFSSEECLIPKCCQLLAINAINTLFKLMHIKSL